MKKLILIIITTVSLLALAGCNIFESEHVHEFGDWSTVKEASCTEDGNRTRSCSCGETEKETLPKTGHVEEIIAGYSATCTEAGLAEGKKCTVCGEITVKQEEIASLEHDYKYSEETDENDNITIYGTCQRANCGTTIINPAGLYDKDSNLIASWSELVDDYGIKVDNGVLSVIHDTMQNNDLRNGTLFVIDDSINLIASNAFAGCTFTHIVIPNSVTEIESFAFANSFITTVFIPDSVIKIGKGPFSNCGQLTQITVDVDNENYKSIDGNLYTKDEKTFIQYANGKKDSEYNIPNGVEIILSDAMSYSNFLKKIIIPKTINCIERYAFSESASLKNVYFLGTTEEWNAIDNTNGWLSNTVVIHYDGKLQFYANTFVLLGGSAYSRDKVVIDDDLVYYNYAFDTDVLYNKITFNDSIVFENSSYILSKYESSSHIDIWMIFT